MDTRGETGDRRNWEVGTDTCALLIVLSQSCGEGNGTPLQSSCLENPMDGGAWWAAVHEVARVRHD